MLKKEDFSMKLYYYAHSGHKNGLDRVKKAVALLKHLNRAGLDTMLLVNDFRAGLVAREFGITESVTIETIQDIDAIAEHGDVIIIDSPENHRGRLEKYCTQFKRVFRLAQSCDDKSQYGEVMLHINCEDEACISSLIIDDVYFKEHEKVDRTLFFLSDSDADKTILSNGDFFEGEEMELLLGHYFYIKYEEDLAKVFKKLHEPEEYIELISTSKRVVTASLQCALEAGTSGAEVVYILTEPLDLCIVEKLRIMQVRTIEGFDKIKYKHVMLDTAKGCHLITQECKTIASKIINNLDL